MEIPRISTTTVIPIPDLGTPQKPTSSVGDVGKSFQDMLSSLSQSESGSNDLLQKLSLGENVDIHQVMIGMEENDVNFRVALAIRDKLVDAYREVMRMQV